MIAALYVETGGCYFGLPDVDPWDETRDARRYFGPDRVIAHPPCAAWCQMAPVNQARYGRPIGADGGCFEAALWSVRLFGGVLEHPAVSIAWRYFGLPRPPREGWSVADVYGGAAAQVEQGNYGHAARKKTWLYAVGVPLPELKWGAGPKPTGWISADRPRAELAAMGFRQIQKPEARRTPLAFRDILIEMVSQ